MGGASLSKLGISHAIATGFLFLFLLPTAHAVENKTVTPSLLTFSFSNFVEPDRGSLSFLGESNVNQGALQITPDTQNNPGYLINNTGRVLLSRRIKLWEDVPLPRRASSNSTNTTAAVNATAANGRRVASFNTTFDINVFHSNGSLPGEGLTFLIASSLDQPPPGSYGGYLGLTNATTDGEASNRFVAVELDTVKQPYDPDDNHLGLDINGVVSNATASLAPLGIEISPEKGTNYTVWIDYDGAARHIWVYMALQHQPKPASPALNASLDLSSYVDRYSYFGFSASTGTRYELNCILNWKLSVDNLGDDGSGSGWKLGLGIGLPVGALALGAMAAAGFFYLRRKRVRDDPRMLEGTLRSLPGMPREFTFKELKKATDNFDEKMKLGQGGFGVVYRGLIPGEDIEVAVKKFSRENSKCEDDFLAELSIINRLRHRHLVRLRGWCHKNGVLLLVYDYMPNGSLDQHIFGGSNRPLLTWERRYNVVVGVASALHYLHNEYDEKVVHRDLKASNVMLDAAFNARLGDFGLARALETDKTSYAELELGGVPGTLGYIAPECFHTGKATRESDVFGFGAVVLETVCGRRPRCDIAGFQFLADWVWKLHREGRILDAVDRRLREDIATDDAERLLLLGLACSHPIPGERPKTEAIVQIISRSVPPPPVPPFKPAFVWPSGPADDEDDDATSSRMTTSTGVTSSYYASSAGSTAHFLSREGR